MHIILFYNIMCFILGIIFFADISKMPNYCVVEHFIKIQKMWIYFFKRLSAVLLKKKIFRIVMKKNERKVEYIIENGRTEISPRKYPCIKLFGIKSFFFLQFLNMYECIFSSNNNSVQTPGRTKGNHGFIVRR